MRDVDLEKDIAVDGETGADDDGSIRVESELLSREDSKKHSANLAEALDEYQLSQISAQLLRDVEEDENSREEWLDMYDRALALLATRILPPRTDVSAGGAPFDGMSSYQDPMFNEACQQFRAGALAELFPAQGPAKVFNGGDSIKDDLAELLEKDINAFLTVGAPEYYPDSDKLLFQVGMAGAGFKKGFHCPLRRRPVIESVEAGGTNHLDGWGTGALAGPGGDRGTSVTGNPE